MLLSLLPKEYTLTIGGDIALIVIIPIDGCEL
jgi:hypothetical protein